MSLPHTVLVGTAGSFIAGVLALVGFHSAGAGLALSATGIVYFIRRRRRGQTVRPWGASR